MKFNEIQWVQLATMIYKIASGATDRLDGWAEWAIKYYMHDEWNLEYKAIILETKEQYDLCLAQWRMVAFGGAKKQEFMCFRGKIKAQPFIHSHWWIQ